MDTHNAAADTTDHTLPVSDAQDNYSAVRRRPSSRRREIEEPVLEGPDHGLSPPDIEETLSGTATVCC